MVQLGYPRRSLRKLITLDILGSLKHALLDLESLTRLSPFLPISQRPPDPLQNDPTINQRSDHAIGTSNYIAQSKASFLCTIMLCITTELAITLTRPLRAPISHLASSLARNITSRLILSLATSDNKPKKDFNMDKLTRETHELHLINPENERSAAENIKLLAQLTALVSAELTKKGKAIFDPGGKSVCIYTGASCTIWTWRQHFISLQKLDNTMINGIASGVKVQGIGVIRFTILDKDDNTIDIIIRDALYVPNAPMCLLCPHQLALKTGKEGDGVNALAQHGVLTIRGFKSIVQYDRHNNLPIFRTHVPNPKAFDSTTATSVIPVPEGDEPPLPAIEEEYPNKRLKRNKKTLLQFHLRCGHLHMTKIQKLAKDGLLPKSISECDIPFCDSCSIEKQTRKPIPHIAEGHLDNDHLKPGDEVSYNQFESSVSGLKAQNLGRATTKRYTCGSVFVDHASRFVFLQLHHSTGAAESLQGKHNFERLATGSGV
jgi:hypothetical protein